MSRVVGRKRTRSQANGGGVGLDGSADINGDEHDRQQRQDSDGGEENDGDGSASQGQRRQVRRGLPAGYDDRNRAFLQAFLAHGALTFDQARPLLAAILNVEHEEQRQRQRQQRQRREDQAGDGNDSDGQEDVDATPALTGDDISMEDLQEFVSKAQQALAPLDFEIRTAVDQVRGERLWALASRDDDPKTAHLAVLFTPRKLAFVRRLLMAIFDTYNTPRLEALCITEQQALKLSRPPRSVGAGGGTGGGAGGDEAAGPAAANRDRGLKHSVVLSLLQSLVRQGWLDKSEAGFYSISTRTLLELEPVLLDAFNDGGSENATASGSGSGSAASDWQRIKRCAACRDLLTVGRRCAKMACSLRLHDHCEEIFWRTQQGGGGGGGAASPKCPRCQTAWAASAASAGSSDVDRADSAVLYYVGERAITTTDVYKRKKRQGRPSEGVDDLMRQVLPRTVPVAALPVRSGRASALAREQPLDESDEASVMQDEYGRAR